MRSSIFIKLEVSKVVIREIEKQDLNNLLLLYTQLHNDPIPENSYVLKTLWRKY
ncbi:hypothetical protein SDC9_159979 [bioreactor metagenome]|uniref:Uncharacterized protein n=1 Tax=bioreactor metagenome TaxID=1076179 RepID=A0A645FFD0_9ZZZZ